MTKTKKSYSKIDAIKVLIQAIYNLEYGLKYKQKSSSCVFCAIAGSMTSNPKDSLIVARDSCLYCIIGVSNEPDVTNNRCYTHKHYPDDSCFRPSHISNESLFPKIPNRIKEHKAMIKLIKNYPKDMIQIRTIHRLAKTIYLK
jgi:hypothetical protein